MAELIDGKQLANLMQEQMKEEVAQLKERGITPGLVVLLVGEDTASQVYVRNKDRAAAKIGIHSKVERYPETITEAELLAEIQRYNEDPAFHGRCGWLSSLEFRSAFCWEANQDSLYSLWHHEDV